LLVLMFPSLLRPRDLENSETKLAHASQSA